MKKRIRLEKLFKTKKAHSKTGPFGTQFKASEYVEEGIPMLNVKNIGFGDIRMAGLEFLSIQKVQELNKHILKENDIVFGRKGAVERHSLISKNESGWVQGSDCIRLRFLTGDYDPTFISYFFRTEQHKKWMINLGSFGATMTSLNQEIISKIEIPDIPFDTQQKIASTLSAYDDLIENNKQRIQLLEEMAEELYKEWFVRLRFPGWQEAKYFKEGVEVERGTEGALPEGWEKVKISAFGKIITGKTPSKKDETNFYGDIPFIKTPDLEQGIFLIQTNETLSLKGANSQKRHYIPKNSIVVSCIGTVGKLGITSQRSQTNQQINSIIPSKKEFLEFLYFKILTLKPTIESFAATGATMANLSKTKFENLKVIKPDFTIIEKYHIANSKIFKQIYLLLQKNLLLQETRDLLLPRLMSGKLDVTKLGV